MADSTIFALSSGLPPAGIAVIRISGPAAGLALQALAGKLPPPRHARHCVFHDPANGAPIDDGLALWFPGPHSATGDDLAELHIHGGRAVVATMLATLARHPGLREAQAGEFTRRAFENGRIDLTQAEGIADLLTAETESQRQAALLLAEGALGRHVAAWQAQLLAASAAIEAALDFADEGDVPDDPDTDHALARLVEDMAAILEAPPAERLRDGLRVVLAGPPNSGKSSLFNILVGRQAAIVTDIAGTTRDRIEAPVAIDGLPLILIDTAGLHEDGDDPVEQIGMARASEAIGSADIVLWLGPTDAAPGNAVLIAARCDLDASLEGLAVSAKTGQGLNALRALLLDRARALLPKPGSLALNARHRMLVGTAHAEIAAAANARDPLIAAEHLRSARAALDAITGKAGVEDMLDALFGALCIGK